MRTRLATSAFLTAVLTAAGLSAPAWPAVAGGPRSAEVTLTGSALQGVHGIAPDATVRNVLTVTARGSNLGYACPTRSGPPPSPSARRPSAGRLAWTIPRCCPGRSGR